MRTIDAAAEQSTRERHLPGEAGIWVLVFGGLIEFALLFTMYLWARRHDPAGFAEAQRSLNQSFGVLNTILLLTASLLVALAVKAVAAQQPKQRVAALVSGAIGCAVGFSVVKAIEYADKWSHGLTWAMNDFYHYYFILTGLHLLHLVVGLGALCFMLALARRGSLTTAQFSYFESAACYWHMVDVLWIVLFPLLYLLK